MFIFTTSILCGRAALGIDIVLYMYVHMHTRVCDVIPFPGLLMGNMIANKHLIIHNCWCELSTQIIDGLAGG